MVYTRLSICVEAREQFPMGCFFPTTMHVLGIELRSVVLVRSATEPSFRSLNFFFKSGFILKEELLL